MRLISLSCPLCPQLDSALHIPFRMPTHIIIERHNFACSMIFKAISKTGPLESCFFCMDIGSSERLAMQNLQIPKTTETRSIPKWLFPPRFSDKIRFTSSHPDAVLIAPILAKTKKLQSNIGGRGGVLRSERGQLRETGSTSAAPPAISRSTFFARQH